MNNEEKILLWLEKLDNRIGTLDQTLNSRIDTLDKTLNKRMDTLEGELKKTNITIENDLKPKIEALFDGYKQNSDKLDYVITRLDIIEEKVEAHDIHIKVLNKRKKNVK